MERKIGEIFDYEGVKLQAIEDDENGCKGCYFNYHCSGFVSQNCVPSNRKDRKNIKYKKL